MKMVSRQVYNFIKLATTIAQDNYPEILGKYLFLFVIFYLRYIYIFILLILNYLKLKI